MNWDMIFGKLRWDSFVFTGAFENPSSSEFVAFGAGSIVILGAICVVALLSVMGWWVPLWKNWLTSLDHKRIGIMYIVLAIVMFVRAVIEAGVMRSQQLAAYDGAGYLAPDHFAQLFTTHGTIMIFFVAMPMITGFMNYIMPLQIGARDVTFPLLNAISLALTAAGAVLVMASLVLGEFSTGGWSAYPPYTGLEYSPGVGVDYWIWAVTLSTIGSTMTAINLLATVYKNRCPGMTLMQMPLFSWTTLCASALMLFALAPLTAATTMLALDRYLEFNFFTNSNGGNMMNYANLFWLFGHPEVYILILPVYGMWSEIVPTFSAKKLYGYRSLVYATIGIAFVSFLVWLHHFFTMGQSAAVNVAFGIGTMIIGIPTGVKIYDWMLTMFRGRIRLTTPMLFHIYFIVVFIIGGMTGILLSNPTVDFQVHNSLFLIAHFHNMIIPGVLYGLFAGYIYWFPKVFGFRLDEAMGRRAFWCFAPGFILAFFPLYFIGMTGATRRTISWSEPAYLPYFAVAMLGVLLIMAGVAYLIVQVIVSYRDRQELAVPLGDPWDGRSLEWSIPSPPPEYNFAVIPVVTSRDAFAENKEAGIAYQPPKAYEDVEIPRNSMSAPLIGLAALALAFALVWHIWWLVIVSFIGLWAVVIARSFVTNTMKIIPASLLKAENEAFLAAIRDAVGVNRDLEMSPQNRGKAIPDLLQHLPERGQHVVGAAL
ncbi:cytochrome ubiquinol oxidase subunit I [Aureimonas fodinaquatilis]|uniref:Cytochrome ubiquinol oxidase subunit I n=1 Tax=Aureimonas fodinaquatilis TaxID=2565783 RepID=A0A5B0DV43_9HYPH|nr:cbb3-type cytochrome c oxidase subunit I [Aureimonas fodinaquatilis]KAA0969069.1 cytochrome ubiquinol oxidase subunit I [Aureimonas fodinaquatilis]